MASKNILTCDRCDKEISNGTFRSKIVNAYKKGRTIKIHKIIGLGGWDSSYDLCRDCTDELEKFLRKE